MLLCVLILVVFGTSPAVTRVTNNGGSSCSLTSYGDLDAFKCDGGRTCVELNQICDGIRHCLDGRDELFCSSPSRGPPKPGKCVVPPYPEHGFFVSNIPNARPGQPFDSFVLEVRCNQDYGIAELYGKGGDGSQQVFCIDGSIIQQMPKCTRFCKLNPDRSVRYKCQVPGTNAFKDCENYVPPDMVVQPVCNNNYYYNGVLKRMRCVAGVGSFDSVAQCKRGLTHNGTNITKLFKDKVKAYISDMPYTSEIERDNVSINSINSKHEDFFKTVARYSYGTVNFNNNIGGTVTLNIISSTVNINFDKGSYGRFYFNNYVRGTVTVNIISSTVNINCGEVTVDFNNNVVGTVTVNHISSRININRGQTVPLNNTKRDIDNNVGGSITDNIISKEVTINLRDPEVTKMFLISLLFLN